MPPSSPSREVVARGFNEGHAPTIGIITAVPGESGTLLEQMDSVVSEEQGLRTFHTGTFHRINTVLVAARIGKVAAAATVAHLIVKYHVDAIIFTGVAGALDPSLNVGDVVVANSLIQHDLDGRPFCDQYEIPILKIRSPNPDPLLTSLATAAAKKFVDGDLPSSIPSTVLTEFHISAPKVVEGLVITGDQVISQESQKARLKLQLPDALCVEMEGASVGQICHEYGIPFVVIRTISDYANHQHHPHDIRKFIQMAAGFYSTSILSSLYTLIQQKMTVN